MYFNIKISCKINLTITFLNINAFVIVFKKKYGVHEKIIYSDFVNKLIKRYKRTKSKEKVKSHFNYLKYVKKISKLFLIKNIHLYPEDFNDLSSFAIEFIVVNNVIKKSLLNG